MKESITNEAYWDTGNNVAVAIMFGLGIGLLILGNHIGGIVGISIDFLSDLICLMMIIAIIMRTFRKTDSFKAMMINWAIFAWWFIIEFIVIATTNK